MSRQKKQKTEWRWQEEAKISEENETNEICELTGSILRPSQPFSLRVALHTDDVQAFSLLQSEVGLIASEIRTSLHLVDGLQGADQLTHGREKQIDYYIYLSLCFNRRRCFTDESQMNKEEWTAFACEQSCVLTLNFFLASCSFFSRSLCSFFSASSRFFSSLSSFALSCFCSAASLLRVREGDYKLWEPDR